MSQYDCTVIVPVYGRPLRTLRMLASLVAQRTSRKYQILLIGDGCPVFQQLMDGNMFVPFKNIMDEKGGDLSTINLMHSGGYGYNCRNVGRTLAEGEYILFADNDDVVNPFYVHQYVNRTKEFGLQFGLFPTMVMPSNAIRIPQMTQGNVGHSELCVRADYLKLVPEQGPEYGHDWDLIYALARAGGKYHIFENVQPAYYVMSLPNIREQGID